MNPSDLNLGEETTITNGDDFALLTDGPRDALLVDLRSGDFYILNSVAGWIWARVLSGLTPQAIRSDLSARFHLDGQKADQDVASALALEQAEDRISTPENPYDMSRCDTGHRLARNDGLMFEINHGGTTLRRIDRHALSANALVEPLGSLLPNILAIRGETVFHAAVISHKQQVIAFMGPSGAGKTTTARSFKSAGAHLICEDKALIAKGASDLAVLIDGEHRVAEWARETSVHLTEFDHAVDLAPLADATSGKVVSTGTVLLLNANARAPGTAEISIRPMDRAAATSALMAHIFSGQQATSHWRTTFAYAAALSGRLTVCQAVVPQGLESVAQAAQTYLQTLG